MPRSRNCEGTLPPLDKQLHQARDQLAVLTGQLAGRTFSRRRFDLDRLALPTDLPLGVPSQLVERRPDVRAAEAQLHAATAEVGVAIANLLPQFTITGDIGSTATVAAAISSSRARASGASAPTRPRLCSRAAPCCTASAPPMRRSIRPAHSIERRC